MKTVSVELTISDVRLMIERLEHNLVIALHRKENFRYVYCGDDIDDYRRQHKMNLDNINWLTDITLILNNVLHDNIRDLLYDIHDGSHIPGDQHIIHTQMKYADIVKISEYLDAYVKYMKSNDLLNRLIDSYEEHRYHTYAVKRCEEISQKLKDQLA